MATACAGIADIRAANPDIDYVQGPRAFLALFEGNDHSQVPRLWVLQSSSPTAAVVQVAVRCPLPVPVLVVDGCLSPPPRHRRGFLK